MKIITPKSPEWRELNDELKKMTLSLRLSFDDLCHIDWLTQTQIGSSCSSLSEYEEVVSPSRYERIKEVLAYIDEHFNTNETKENYNALHDSLNEYRRFLSQEKRKIDVEEALGWKE